MITEVNIGNDSPNSDFSVTLGDQFCTIQINTLGDFLFMSLQVDGKRVFDGLRCTVWQQLGYLSNDFSGALFFSDEEGNSDPIWFGLGERWRLYYVSADDPMYLYLENREVIKQWHR